MVWLGKPCFPAMARPVSVLKGVLVFLSFSLGFMQSSSSLGHGRRSRFGSQQFFEDPVMNLNPALLTEGGTKSVT